MNSQRIFFPNHLFSVLSPFAPIFGQFLKHTLDGIPIENFNQLGNWESGDQIVMSVAFFNNSFVLEVVKRSIVSHLEEVGGYKISHFGETVVGVDCVIVVCLSNSVLIKCELVVELA